MSNKLSVSRVVLLGSAIASVALVAAGMVLETKPVWLDLATPIAVVATLWMLWLEARKFSFDTFVENEKNSQENEAGTVVHLTSDQIRVFGSLEDGQRHGWTFEEKVGDLGKAPVYLWAQFQGKKWKYDGLNGEAKDAIIPEEMRLFGKMRYLACEPALESAITKSITVEKLPSQPSALHPALNRTP